MGSFEIQQNRLLRQKHDKSIKQILMGHTRSLTVLKQKSTANEQEAYKATPSEGTTTKRKNKLNEKP